MSGGARARGIVAALAIAAAAVPVPAGAHGGKTALQLTAGPYRIEALVSRSGDTIDETLTVRDAASGRPVTAGLVTMTLEETGGETGGPYAALAAGGVFEVRYPPPAGGKGRVSITIQGPLGEVTVSHPYVAPASAQGDWLVMAAVLLGLIVAPFVAYRWWLTPRRRAGAGVGPAGAV